MCSCNDKEQRQTEIDQHIDRSHKNPTSNKQLYIDRLIILIANTMTTNNNEVVFLPLPPLEILDTEVGQELDSFASEELELECIDSQYSDGQSSPSLSGSGSVSASGSGSGGRSTKSRNSLFGHREAEDNEVDLDISILADHPFKTTKTEISKNSRLVSKGGSNFHLNESEWGDPVCQFIKALSGLSSCFNKKSRFFVKCTCLSKLKRFDRAQLYLFCMVSMSKRDQYMVNKELINARMTRTTGYNLWMGKSKRNGFTFNVCRYSFVNVLNLSDERIKTINEMRLYPGPNVHRNTGNKNACHSKELHQSVVLFVKDKGETCDE
jgi:hypothetical protein